jgi:hypothetical protein
MAEPDYLFAESDLRTDLENHERRMAEQIRSMDPDEFLKTSPEDLARYLIEEFTIDVPTLQVGDISVTQGEAQVDVSHDRTRVIYDRGRPFYLTGTEIAFYVPFEGDANLFRCVPSSRSTMLPAGVVSEGELVLSYTRLAHDSDALRAQFESDLGRIRQYLTWVGNDVRPFNDALPHKVQGAIEQRREKVLADKGLAASLGYKLRVREDAPRTYAVPTKRRNPPIRPPKPAATEPFEPEPELLMKEYGEILDILSNMVGVIERSPAAFKRMKEEDLRHHFLVQLNAQYEGQATGETFNFEGKTDILIRTKGRNVFIAECKFWRGPKALTEAVDQLLGYASWRDTKTAILLFNRTKNLSAVLTKVPEIMEAHPNHKRRIGIGGETRFRFVFGHRDDLRREMLVTVLVFETPE